MLIVIASYHEEEGREHSQLLDCCKPIYGFTTQGEGEDVILYSVKMKESTKMCCVLMCNNTVILLKTSDR